ncbi:GDSL family lipase [Duganella radicis]|uniref:GDSL family lipase n=2 Tax=Duganella radicis TaxID=551988 RepID=A0A6L6PLP7_9BURK|nr:GDSL family lipase [Duganella radicis]
MIALLGALIASSAMAEEARVAAISAAPGNLTTLPASIAGRVLKDPAKGYQYQWPGIYFDAAFEGKQVYFNVGPGNVILRVLVDSVEKAKLVKPAAGWYQVDGLNNTAHTIRVEVISESQAGPNIFGGFALDNSGKVLPLSRRARQIEFIGDSHTVSYGNTSASRDCSEEQVWATTDTSQGFGAITARHYGADYRVQAISGRGVVRNYNGFAADTLPAAYPYILFNKADRDTSPDWRPQLIVIALGTNDFSTPLNPGEKWKTREALQADYVTGYVDFVRSLRAGNPDAYFILWATDGANGEIQAEVGKVVAKLKAGGEDRVHFMPVNKLTFGGCHWHPSVADDRTIANGLTTFVDAHPELWTARKTSQ